MRIGDVVRLKHYGIVGRVLKISNAFVDVIADNGSITTYKKDYLEFVSSGSIEKGVHKVDSTPLEIGQYYDNFRVMDFEIDKIVCVDVKSNLVYKFEIYSFLSSIKGLTFPKIFDAILKYEHVLLVCPRQKYFLPDNEISSNSIENIISDTIKKSIVDENAFGKLDIISSVTYGIRKMENPYYITMLISKKPPIFKIEEKNYDFIYWKFYAGLMSSSTYRTERRHTYNFINYKIQIYDTGKYVDWRAPVCELFYNYKNTKELEFDYTNIKDSKQFELYKQENLNNAPVNYFHKTIFRAEFIRNELDNTYIYNPTVELNRKKSQILQAALKRNKTNGCMREIIESIQPEQYEMIKKSLNSQLILQGCAGSGKTMILYHRISYMIYSGFDVNDGIVLTPNNLLNNSIKNLLSDLNLNNLRVGVFEKYIQNIILEYTGIICNNEHIEKDYDENLIEQFEERFNEMFEYIYKDLKMSYSKILYLEESSWTKGIFLQNCLNSYEEFMNRNINKLMDLKTFCNKYANIFDEKIQLAADLKIYLREVYLNLECTSSNNTINLIHQVIDEFDALNIDAIISFKIFYDNIQKEMVIYIYKSIKVVKEQLESDIFNVIKYFNTKYRKTYSMEDFLLEVNAAKDYGNKTVFSKLFSRTPDIIKELNTYIMSTDSLLKDKILLVLFINRFIENNIDSNDLPSYIKHIDLANYEMELEKINTKIVPKVLNELKILISDYKSLEGLGENNIFKRLFIFKQEYSKIIVEFKNIPDKIRNIIFDSKLDFNVKKSYVNNIVSLINMISDSKNKMLKKYTYIFCESLCSEYLKFDISNSLLTKLLFCYFFYGPRKNKDKYIFIDEAQDFNLNYYKIINYVNSNPILNLFGDINQRINKLGLEGWHEIIELNHSTLYEINDNYRNPVEICTYCNEKFNLSMVPIGDEAGIVKTLSVEDFINKINSTNSFNNTVLICNKDNEYARKLLHRIHFITDRSSSDKLMCLTPIEAKGLEFNTVFVCESGMDAQSRYVSYTRSLDKLYILK